MMEDEITTEFLNVGQEDGHVVPQGIRRDDQAAAKEEDAVRVRLHN